MSKLIKPKGWSIMYFDIGMSDKTPYQAQYEYVDKNGKHELTKDFATYGEAYNWLLENIIL